MPLSNRQKLEIIARAKKNGYRGDYLELFRMAEQQMRQDKPEVEFRHGGFPGDINVQGFSNVQVPNPVPTDPALGVNVSGFNLSKDFNLGKNFNLNISNPGLVHSRASYYNKPVDTFGSLKIPFEPKVGLSYNFEGGGFSNDINKPKKSTYVDARSGYGFPTTYEHGGPHNNEMPVVNVPEVSISALSNESYDRLNQPQRVLYDMYTDPEGATRQTLPIDIGRENRQVGDIHWRDALRMAEGAPRTQIYDTPYFAAYLSPDKHEIDSRTDYFRAHAHPASGNIYVPPSHAYHSPGFRHPSFKDEYGNTFDDYTDNRFKDFYIDPRTNKPWGGVELPEGFVETIGTVNMNREGITPAMYEAMYKERMPYSEETFLHTDDEIDRIQQGKRMSDIIAEYAHTSREVTNPRDGIIGRPATFFDRVKRAVEEGKWPDRSNYESPGDLEYHTHTSPTSAENQLYDKYNFDRYDLTKPKQKKEGGHNVKYDHGGFAAFFASDYDKYVKKENGGTKGTVEQYVQELTDPVRKRIGDNLYPYQYLGGITRVPNAILGNREERDDRTFTEEDNQWIKERTDLLQIYMGQDQKYNSIPKSKYKPSQSEDDDVTYYISPATEDIIKHQIEMFDGWESFYTRDDEERQMTNMGNILGRFTLSKGEDEKGKYISYYDKWDFNPFDYNKLPGGKELGKAYDRAMEFIGMDAPEVYGRVYINDVLQKEEGGLGDPPTKLQGLLPFQPQSPISTTNMTGQQLRNALMQYLHDTGRDTVNVNTAMRAIGEMESRNNPMAVQVSGNKKTGFYPGPGKGKYQFEDTPRGAANTAVNRLVDLTKSKLGVTPTELPADFRPGVHKLPVYPELASIYKTTAPNVTELDEKYQDALFIADNILGKNTDGTLRADIFNEAVNKTNMSQEDVFKLWLRNHKKEITVPRKGKNVTIDVNKATKKEINAEMKKWMDRTSTSFE